MSTQSNAWVSIPRNRPEAHLRLFCFSYAGGSASTYYSWAEQLGEKIEVCAIQYPGREKRILEPLFDDFTTLLDALVPAILPFLSRPFAFFGHSMGAIICFELAHRLRNEYALNAQHLFVSAHRAPHLPDPQPLLHQLSEDEFKNELQKLDGTSERILENEEMMALLTPILRADFAVGKTFEYVQREPLPCTISAFGGKEDPSVSQRELECWQEQTSGTFTLKMFPGGHFFLHKAQPQLLHLVSQNLAYL